MTRLNRYCAGLIEASWLMAIIVTTLAINNYTERSFEPMKILPLRSIVWLALAIWGIKIISQGGLQFKHIVQPRSPGEFFKLPLALPVAGLFLSILLSLLFSISFHLSLRGSYFRAAGALTDVSYILYFILIAANLRRRDQIERIFATLAFSSFLVAAYAILQRMGLDPHSWNTIDASQRAFSTIGHPIFAAAFMTMVLFILAGKTVLAFQDFLLKRASRMGDLLRAILYGLIALLNLIAIWFANSRGPLLGLMAGLAVFILFLLSYWRMKRALQGILVLGIAGFVFLVLLNLPTGPLVSVRDSFGPLGRVFESESGTGLVRSMVWEGMARLVAPHAPIQFPSGEADRWNIIRPWIGYGPDTLALTFEGYYDPKIYLTERYNVLFDRAHNHFWDMLAFYGILGMLAEYGLFLVIIFYILDWTGWLASPFEKKLYWGVSATGGLAGGIVFGIWLGAGFVGVGFPFGLLTGLAGIFIRRAFHPSGIAQIPPRRMILLTSFLSAIIAHYVELLFGIAVVNTNLLFWLFCALTVIIGFMPSVMEEETPSAESSKSRQAKPTPAFREDLRQVAVASGLIVGTVILIGYWLIYKQQNGISEALTYALTVIPTQPPSTSYGILLMFLTFILVAPVLLQLEHDSELNRKPSLPNILLTTGIGLFSTVVVWSIRVSQLISMEKYRHIGDAAGMADSFTGIYTTFCIFLLLALLATGSALSNYSSVKTEHRIANSFPTLIGYVLPPVLALGLSVYFNVWTIYTDFLVVLAKNEMELNHPEIALDIYNRGVELDPTDNAYMAAYNLYSKAALIANSQASRDQLFQSGVEALQQGYNLQPLYVNNSIALAYHYQVWGDATANDALRSFRLSQADHYYRYALMIKPDRVDYLVEWAKLSASQGDIPAAEQKIQSALAINPAYEPAYYIMGTLYLDQASQSKDELKRAYLLEKALRFFQDDLDLLASQGGSQAFAQLGIARVYAERKQYEAAAPIYLQALGMNLEELTWLAYAELADVYRALNETAFQRKYLEQAISIAPPMEVPALQAELDALTP